MLHYQSSGSQHLHHHSVGLNQSLPGRRGSPHMSHCHDHYQMSSYSLSPQNKTMGLKNMASLYPALV